MAAKMFVVLKERIANFYMPSLFLLVFPPSRAEAASAGEGPKAEDFILKPIRQKILLLQRNKLSDILIFMSVTQIEKSNLRTDLSEVHPGDTVKVVQKIKEGDKERLTAFKGLVIAKKHGQGISGTFTVRKVVGGIGVERVFPLHSPMIDKVEVLRRSKVRRAKLYYIREKAAREVRKKMKKIWREPEMELSEPTTESTAQ